MQCASLRVVQIAAVIMIVFGLITKESMFVLSIPTPIVGGLLLVLLSILAGVGLAHLRYVDLTSSRNVFIVGVSLASGIVIPMHVGPANDFVMTRKFSSAVPLRTISYRGSPASRIWESFAPARLCIRKTPEDRWWLGITGS
ncbi:hypothetical protein HPB50_020353 [Hyalomma asiaticum]|uniref:Uncharacterized protein n=1 Tax=Hyalomma asiaticum TaxID=266040 RepID=A0ACB7SRS1_HYAAI|nr:hypothetical protein HPB50_020353 [Hyalomma asiaticum]